MVRRLSMFVHCKGESSWLSLFHVEILAQPPFMSRHWHDLSSMLIRSGRNCESSWCNGKSSRWWVIAASVSEQYLTLKLQAKFPLYRIQLNSLRSRPFFACQSSDRGSIPAGEVLLFSSNLFNTGCDMSLVWKMCVFCLSYFKTFNIYFMGMATVVSSTTIERSQCIIYIETPTGYKLLLIQGNFIKNLIFKNKVFWDSSNTWFHKETIIK